MNVETVDLGDCERAARRSDALVVIDVLRAFTTASAALAAGGREVVAVDTVDAARRVAAAIPDAVLIGEVDGLPVAGFDLPNSPVAVGERAVAGRTIVQRTTAGTQGLVRGRSAPVLLAAAFANAAATAAHLRALAPERVAFVVTGSHSADRGEEDRALADYLGALLQGRGPDPTAFLDRVRGSAAAASFAPGGRLEAFGPDVEYCAGVDRVAFAMRAGAGPGAYPTLRAVIPAAPAGAAG